MRGKNIPNVAPVGRDVALEPVVVEVPLILMDNGTDFLWYPEAMDKSTADRIVAMSPSNMLAYRVTVPLILPAAQHIEAATTMPELLTCKPIRVKLHAPE